MTSHFVIPDPQCKPDLTYEHLEASGNYIIDKQPEVIIHLGDHYDMGSLSSYDKRGSKYFEGKRYIDDIEAGLQGMEALLNPINIYNRHRKRNKLKQYKPRMIFLMGNHENRIHRAVNEEPKLEGIIGLENLKLDSFGWEVQSFLVPININEIYYSHYFYNPFTGKPYGGTINTMLNNVGFSFTQGHRQGKQIGEKHLANGKTIRGLVCGSFYQHTEEYRGPQGQNEWRGCIHKTEVRNGNYSLAELSINYLMKEWL